MHRSTAEDAMAATGELEERDLVGKIADVVSKRAGIHLVYADPIVRDDVTVVPIARIRFGFGGGAGPASSGQTEGRRLQNGGGGGGGVVAAPAGFLVVRGSEVSYRPIRDPVRTALAVAAGALGVSFALRALRRLLR
jgi:uncharacterized spore protein YtfJ